MSDSHQQFMQLAINLAAENVEKCFGGPFGAVVVKDGEIIAASANTVTATNDPTAHAEIAAIRLACQKLNTYNLEGCVIYASCEPCPMCLSAIYWARIGQVYYSCTKEDAADAGFDDAFIYEQMSLAPRKRNVEFIQLMRQESQTAFEQWKKAETKEKY